jgi:hypothetical protein
MLILPSRPQRGRRRVLLPPGVDIGQPKYFCLVPGCGAKFQAGREREYQAHVVWCADVNDERLHPYSPAHMHPGLMGPESGDVEFERWVQRNRRALLERRLKM